MYTENRPHKDVNEPKLMDTLTIYWQLYWIKTTKINKYTYRNFPKDVTLSFPVIEPDVALVHKDEIRQDL